MGLFGREESAESKSTSVTETATRFHADHTAGSSSTLIAKGTTVDGALKGSGEIRVEGSVTGKLECAALVTVAESGRVEAEIEAETVTIAGTVRGNVTGSGKIELAPSANVEGDITAPRILIREGATFEGQVFMTGKKAATASEKTKPAGKDAKETPKPDNEKK